MIPPEFLILIESNATILSIFILVITSFVFGYVIPYRLEPKIEELESEIREKMEFFNGLQSDHNQFQNWEAKGLALRDTMFILEVVNITIKNKKVSELIANRIGELMAVKVASILVLSAKLGIPKNEVNSWKELDIPDLEEKKIEVMRIWYEKSRSTLSERTSLEKSIQAKKRKKSKIVLGTLVLQSLGTYLSFTGSR